MSFPFGSTKMWGGAVLGTLAALSLAACAASGGTPATPAPPPASVFAGTLAATKDAFPPDALHRKLYVSDFGSNSILEFPLVKGIPAGTPSNSITGLNGPISIAFDSQGNLYESDLGSSSVKVFGRRATGNAKPKRTLDLPQGAYAIALDANGYLYAQGGFTDVYVYAPGAHGHAAPLFDINNFPGGQVESVSIAPSGALYITSWAVNGALVYTTPETNPTLAGEFVDASLAGPIGIGFDNNEMYVVDSGNNAVKAYSTFIGTVSPDRVITSTSVPMSSPTDIDAFGNSLFVTDPSNGSGPTDIFQFNPLRGAQKPKSVLAGSGSSGFSNAQDAQLGP